MDSFLLFTATLCVLTGTFFSIVSVLGYLRLPDVYTRLHTAGKIGVFSAVLFLIAAAVWEPVGWGNALVLIVFIIAAGPPTAHAIGSAAHRIGLPRIYAVRDDLAEPPCVNQTSENQR